MLDRSGTAVESHLAGPVLVVGSGLMGASVGLALSRRGIPVLLSDSDPAAVRLAVSVGAGLPHTTQAPQLVLVAVPPDHLGAEVVRALRTWPEAVVTDVGSVKAKPLDEVAASGLPAGAYVGGHPMAGSERSGPLAATADLFDGRAWAVTPHPGSTARAVALVEAMALACGATVVRLSPREHDAAVARVSHLPHVLAVLTAARLVEASPVALSLSGQGLRDVTRVAGGDPVLWQQVLTANADAVGALLRDVRDDLDRLLAHLRAVAGEGGDGGDGADDLTDLLVRGVIGMSAIPGKHGRPSAPAVTLFVLLPDEPGALARLFAAAGEAAVNIEDVRIDHDPGRPVGLMELTVADDGADRLAATLRARGWAVHR